MRIIRYLKLFVFGLGGMLLLKIIELWERVLDFRIYKYSPLYQSAKQKFDQGYLIDPLISISKLINKNPNASDLYRFRGDMYREKFSYEKSMMDYNTAIRLDSRNYLAFVGRSELYKLLDRWDNAHKDWIQSRKLRYTPLNAPNKSKKPFDNDYWGMIRAIEVHRTDPDVP
jgi:tetratricopeptide (TPR) repeat protein